MKNHVAVYFASKHGQTRKIACFLAQNFGQRGAEVRTVDLRERPATLPEMSGLDAAVIAGPLYQGTYPTAVQRFVKRHRSELAKIPSTAFLSICLTATPGTPESYAEAMAPVRTFLDDAAWTPQWTASFPGALNYTEYNPILRRIMKSISEKEGGPTDTRKDFYLTRWDEVSQFAEEFFGDEAQSRFRADGVELATRTLNGFLPDFEERIVQRLAVQATPEEVGAALESMELTDMPMGEFLARVRNFGRESGHADQSFLDAAETFGAVAIKGQAHELAGGLTGQFWRKDYGIRRLRSANAFREFADPAYTKALTNFWFGDFRNGKTVIRTETRVHALGPEARRNFRLYWTIVGLGVRLYMRSVLRGIERSLHRRRWEHRPVAI
jgi:menaquinone-dependent protoporphyrinogen oxidase